MTDPRNSISDIITNELFERFESPSSAVIGVALADRILALPEIAEALELLEGHKAMVAHSVDRLENEETSHKLGHSIKVR